MFRVSSELGWDSLLGDSSRLRWCAVDETLLELLPSLRVRRLPLTASGISRRWASVTAATMSGMSAVVKGHTSEELLVFVLFGFGLLPLFARFRWRSSCFQLGASSAKLSFCWTKWSPYSGSSSVLASSAMVSF